MGKRSREASFSPSEDPTSSSVSFSDSGDHQAIHSLKRNALSREQGQDSIQVQVAMQCSLPPHRDAIQFPSIDAFELHYAKDHSNRCSACRKNFPTARFLTLHIDEHHNPLREELEAKGEKTYGCFVEDCEKLCSNSLKRRLHLIDKHAFPKDYNFRVVSTGIDRSTSMLRESANRRRVSTTNAPADGVTKHRRRSSLQPSGGTVLPAHVISPSKIKDRPDLPVMTTTVPTVEYPDPIVNLEQSMAALLFVPPSVTRQLGKKKAS